jgi:hypothetical protein
LTRQHKPNSAIWLGLLLGVCGVLLAANLWRLSQPPRPDPRMVGLAVRATLFAVPTPTPRIVEVTRVVQVVVAVTATPTPTATGTPTPTFTATPDAVSLSEIPPDVAQAEALAADTFAAAAADLGGAGARVAAAEVAAAEVATLEEFAAVAAAPAPAPPVAVADCPQTSGNTYTTIPIDGGGLTHPDALHADLNLSLRGYTPSDAAADLFNKDGPVDGDPPQLAGIFGDYRRPPFGPSYRVYDWDWNCGEHGCRGGLVETGAATLLTVQANPGEALGVPHRGAQIYGGGYKALVLYAESNRITLGYTREDSVANGYAVHLENVCIDPNLVALYQSSNAAGRAFLPALREDETLGTAGGGQVLIAVRDRGVFFDPRSRLDWWWGF